MDIGTIGGWIWFAVALAAAVVLALKLASERLDHEGTRAELTETEELRVEANRKASARMVELEALRPLADLGQRRRDAMDRQHAKARAARAAKAAERTAKPARRRPAK